MNRDNGFFVKGTAGSLARTGVTGTSVGSIVCIKCTGKSGTVISVVAVTLAGTGSSTPSAGNP